MTTPKRPSQKPESASKYMVIAVKILLVLIILFSLPKLVTTMNSDRKKHWQTAGIEVRSVRPLCETETCATFIPEEDMN